MARALIRAIRQVARFIGLFVAIYTILILLHAIPELIAMGVISLW